MFPVSFRLPARPCHLHITSSSNKIFHFDLFFQTILQVLFQFSTFWLILDSIFSNSDLPLTFRKFSRLISNRKHVLKVKRNFRKIFNFPNVNLAWLEKKSQPTNTFSYFYKTRKIPCFKSFHTLIALLPRIRIFHFFFSHPLRTIFCSPVPNPLFSLYHDVEKTSSKHRHEARVT